MPYTTVTPIDKEPLPRKRYRLHAEFSGPGVSPETRTTIVEGGTTAASLKAWAREQMADLNSLLATPIDVPLKQAFDVAATAPTAVETAATTWIASVTDLERSLATLARITALGLSASGQLSTDLTALNTLITNQRTAVVNGYNAAPDAPTRVAMRSKL